MVVGAKWTSPGSEFVDRGGSIGVTCPGGSVPGVGDRGGGLSFDFGRAKRMMTKITNAPKNPMTPAPPMKATTTESTPRGSLSCSVLDSDGPEDGLSIAGQVASGAHLFVPLRAHRVARLMDPFASNART